MRYSFLDWTENSIEDVYFIYVRFRYYKISCLRITENFTYFDVK